MALTKGRAEVTIGLVIDVLSGLGSYQEDIWRGVAEEVKAKGAKLMIFPGGLIGKSPNSIYECNRNIVYDLVRPEYINGLILAGGTIGNYISHEELEHYITRFQPIPMVSISGGLSGMPNILIDNETGLSKLFDHLILKHGCRRIAYIRGPLGNEDAEKRFQVYKQALARHSLPYNEELVFVGSFTEPSGHQAIRDWLDKKYTFDAVAAGNDNMALGAIKELQARGIKVPEQVAVIGFDDVFEASVINPPLTTIRQPVVAQAKKAVEVLFEVLAGKIDGAPLIAVDTEQIIRRSCGCVGSLVHEKISVEINREENQEAWLTSVARAFQNRCQLDIGEEGFRLLFQYFSSAVETKKPTIFLTAWQNFLSKYFTRAEDVSVFKCFLGTFRETLISSSSKLYGKEVEDLFGMAYDILTDIVFELSAKKRTEMENLAHEVSSVGTRLGSAFDIKSIADIIYEVIPSLKINSFIFGLYEDRQKPFKSVTIHCRVEKGKRYELPPTGLRMPALTIFTSDLVCKEAGDQFIVFPLYFKEEQLGLFIMELAPEYGFIYETIYSQLCTSVEGALLFERNVQVRLETEKRSLMIENLSRPMIEAIHEISQLTEERMQNVHFLVGQIQDSWGKINQTNTYIDRIASQISKLMEISKIIEEISERVNLLALNTSIEAAHVGKYGVGFTVIAREIKQLSETTRQHSVEIGGTLKEIIKYAKDSFQYGQESIRSFKEQEKGIADILASFKIIAEKMQRLGENSSEILKIIK